MNKKGITPIIAVVLLLMMTVAAAGAAFYWLTRMQSQAQSSVSGTQQRLLEQSSTAVALISQRYNSGSLIISVQNIGGKTIDLTESKMIMNLEDSDGNAVCNPDTLESGGNFEATISESNLAPDGLENINVTIDTTKCSMTDNVYYYYTLSFPGGASVSGSFKKA